MSTPIHLTVANVIAALDAAVAEKGEDYVYTNADGIMAGDDAANLTPICFYVHNEGEDNECPGCIVGNVLHRLGVPLVILADHEQRSAARVVYSLVNTGVLTEEDDVMNILVCVQSWQDSGTTWGDAVEHATAEFRDLDES